MLVTLDHTEVVAPHVQTFWFKTEQPVRYEPGQFIEMFLPHDNADERGEKHWFTLSSSPSEDLLAITTKHAIGQVSTFKQILFSLKAGAQVRISEPTGDFVLPKDTSIPLVFVAAGIGVTPVRSIIKWLLDTDEKRDIKVIYGVHTEDELAFKELLESYGVIPNIVLTHVDAQLILDIAGTNSEQLFYVSGPEELVEVLEKDLKTAGVDPRKLVLDFFPGYLTP